MGAYTIPYSYTRCIQTRPSTYAIGIHISFMCCVRACTCVSAVLVLLFAAGGLTHKLKAESIDDIVFYFFLFLKIKQLPLATTVVHFQSEHADRSSGDMLERQ